MESEKYHIWDVVVSWRNFIFASEFESVSKSDYLTHMLKLIENHIIDIKVPIDALNEEWLKDCKRKIDLCDFWSERTRLCRKTCLNSFYRFYITNFNFYQVAYRRCPADHEVEYILSSQSEKRYSEEVVIKHVLSNVIEKTKTTIISPVELCEAVSKVNERDAYIVWLMMHTGRRLEFILDLKKENFRVSLDDQNNAYFAYIDFKDKSEYVYGHIADAIKNLSKDSSKYLFESSKGKKIGRTQVIRNLKKAGKAIGLTFDLTPKVLYGYVNAYMTKDKRSAFEQCLGLQTN
jgi:hypothetical protein